MARKDSAPATTGTVAISNNLLATSTIFTWPVFPPTDTSPEMHLRIRIRSDGEMYMALDETWDPDTPFLCET